LSTPASLDVIRSRPSFRLGWRAGVPRARAKTRALHVGVGILAAIVIASIVVPMLTSNNGNAFVGAPFAAPSWSNLLGTDDFGRDVLTRTFLAARLDLMVAVIGVAVPLLSGTALGILAGSSRRRWVDAVFMRIVDAIVAFPFLILVLVLVVLFGTTNSFGPFPAGIPSLFLAIFATSWALYARLARGQTLELVKREFVTAARLMGVSRWRIVWRHLLPLVLRTTATYAVGDAIGVIIVTASLPFLGAGVQPPSPEWGAMMYEGRAVLEYAPWITFAPAALLAMTGISISIIADALIGEERGVR